MTEQIRVIILKDDGLFVAQCLEVDIAAQGRTPEEALGRLRTAFYSEKREAAEAGKTLDDIGPAPKAFHAVYESDVIERTALVA